MARFTFRTSGGQLSGKPIALVTGSGSGIGLGIAFALARRGMDVALIGRRVERLEAAAARLSRLGVRAIAIPADLASPGDRRSVVGRVRSALGPVGILVNNAGVMSGGDLATLPEEKIERGVATNLLAPIELTRQAMPDLIACGGWVTFLASSTSLVPLPSAAVYSATKAGVRAFGESLRYELAPAGVHLLVAYPPATSTGMTRGMSEAAGLPSMRRARPALVGDRIVKAMLAGKEELYFGGSDHLLSAFYKVSPWLVRALLGTQRARFSRMMAIPE